MLILIPARYSHGRYGFAKKHTILLLIVFLKREIQVALNLLLVWLNLRLHYVTMVQFQRLHQRHVVWAEYLIVGLALLGKSRARHLLKEQELLLFQVRERFSRWVIQQELRNFLHTSDVLSILPQLLGLHHKLTMINDVLNRLIVWLDTLDLAFEDWRFGLRNHALVEVGWLMQYWGSLKELLRDHSLVVWASRYRNLFEVRLENHIIFFCWGVRNVQLAMIVTSCCDSRWKFRDIVNSLRWMPLLYDAFRFLFRYQLRTFWLIAPVRSVWRLGNVMNI